MPRSLGSISYLAAWKLPMACPGCAPLSPQGPGELPPAPWSAAGAQETLQLWSSSELPLPVPPVQADLVCMELGSPNPYPYSHLHYRENMEEIYIELMYRWQKVSQRGHQEPCKLALHCLYVQDSVCSSLWLLSQANNVSTSLTHPPFLPHHTQKNPKKCVFFLNCV